MSIIETNGRLLTLANLKQMGEGGVSQRAPIKQFQPEYNPDLRVENKEGE